MVEWTKSEVGCRWMWDPDTMRSRNLVNETRDVKSDHVFTLETIHPLSLIKSEKIRKNLQIRLWMDGSKMLQNAVCFWNPANETNHFRIWSWPRLGCKSSSSMITFEQIRRKVNQGRYLLPQKLKSCNCSLNPSLPFLFSLAQSCLAQRSHSS